MEQRGYKEIEDRFPKSVGLIVRDFIEDLVTKISEGNNKGNDDSKIPIIERPGDQKKTNEKGKENTVPPSNNSNSSANSSGVSLGGLSELEREQLKMYSQNILRDPTSPVIDREKAAELLKALGVGK